MICCKILPVHYNIQMNQIESMAVLLNCISVSQTGLQPTFHFIMNQSDK